VIKLDLNSLSLLVLTDTLIGPAIALGSLITVCWKAVWFVYGPSEGHIVHLRPVGRPHGSLYGSSTVCRKAAWFIYSPSAGHIVHSRSVGRPYSSFTVCRKAVQFILRTISRTHGQLGAPFGRQPRRYLRKEFPTHFCILWFYFYAFFVFYSFIKANYGGYTQAVLFFK